MIMQMIYNKIINKKINMIQDMKNVSFKNQNLIKLKYLQFIIVDKIINFLINMMIKMILIIIFIYYKKNYKIN